MTKKILKIFVCTMAMLCLFCSTLTAFAETESVTYEFNIDPELPTIQESTDSEETEDESDTPNTTEKVTKKPTKPQTTKDEKNTQSNNGNKVNANVQQDNTISRVETTRKETTEEETTDEPLPDGAFYVYLEPNNGQRRLKTVMLKAGYVPSPNIPVRDGYDFDGWFTDPEFTKPWNFSKDKASKQMTIYAKWSASPSTIEYEIKIEDVAGGKLEVNPQKASEGEIVVITPIPDEGKRLLQGSIMINGESTDFLSFTMPKGNVKITATFEDIPENTAEEEKSKLPLIVILAVLGAIILVAIIINVKKIKKSNDDLDDEDLYFDADDGDKWIDKSIVVEDGFKEGKRIAGNTEHDNSSTETDETD